MNNNTSVTVQLYADEYADNNLVDAIVNKKFGFELTLENNLERNRRILTLDQVRKLKASIDAALKAYETVMNHDFIHG